MPLLTVRILRVLLFANFSDVRYWYLVIRPLTVVKCADVRFLYIDLLSSKSRFMCRCKVPFYWSLVQQKSFHVSM